MTLKIWRTRHYLTFNVSQTEQDRDATFQMFKVIGTNRFKTLLLVKAPRSTLTTHNIRSLHWLKVTGRIDYFKLLSLTTSYLHNLISSQPSRKPAPHLLSPSLDHQPFSHWQELVSRLDSRTLYKECLFISYLELLYDVIGTMETTCQKSVKKKLYVKIK